MSGTAGRIPAESDTWQRREAMESCPEGRVQEGRCGVGAQKQSAPIGRRVTARAGADGLSADTAPSAVTDGHMARRHRRHRASSDSGPGEDTFAAAGRRQLRLSWAAGRVSSSP